MTADEADEVVMHAKMLGMCNFLETPPIYLAGGDYGVPIWTGTRYQRIDIKKDAIMLLDELHALECRR